MTAPLDPDQVALANFRAKAKAQLIALWNRPMGKSGWLILAIVCMLVVMKVCF